MTTPLIRRLTLQNFLSYGPEGVSVDLLPLNVLIGPNASGKSNLLETLAVLRGAAGDLQAVVREGGGFSEFLWKGSAKTNRSMTIEVTTDDPFSEFLTICHRLEFGGATVGILMIGESITTGFVGEEGDSSYIYSLRRGTAEIKAWDGRGYNLMKMTDLKINQSVLSQRRDPTVYPELTYLADQFAGIVLFQEWNFGRRTAARLPQPTDLPSDFLLTDASNLGLILHDITQTSAKREELVEYLRRFYEAARSISTKIQGGTLQLFIEEEGGRLTPATRLSDGTLRYLSLLAILCHPSPPPVVGIEEPELGLHPDIIPTIAELLKKASERTQLFVTTHSDALVSALSDTPESILVCEGTPDGTTMKRLDADRLREWLEKYTLGEIWRMGEIGGNRW